MDYAKPRLTVQKINAAGKFISTFDPKNFDRRQLWDAMDVVAHFRACHHLPLDTIYGTLKRRAQKIHTKALSAQRIKRHASIVHKLIWQPEMKLTQMQDIGGCRAVMPTLPAAYALRDLYESKPLIHDFTGEKDYIKNPKDTGYRSIHLKYRFKGKYSSAPWDKLKIEIQIRSLLQHRWATAVEVAGTFTNTALKSNRGNAEWLRFFALMSSVFAIREGCPTVPSTPTTYDELCREIRKLNTSHHIVSTFANFHTLIPQFEKEKSRAKYYLVILNPVTREVQVTGFKKEESRQADAAYSEAEKANLNNSETQVVLVSVSSATALKRAYPNYFLDTADFLNEVLAITESS
jgi:hypothetical protein